MKRIIFIFLLLATSVCWGSSKFAMQSHSLQGDPARHKRTIDLMKNAGITIIRDEMYWSNVEKEKGKPVIPDDWKKNVDYTLSQGIEILIILNYTNVFYDNGDAPTSKEGLEGFTDYCKFILTEFKGKIKYYEIWNEPNTDGFWRPHTDPVAYTNLLKKAYTACKSVDPDVTIIGISCSQIELDFIKTIYENGGYDYMDAVSVHPYTTPRSNDEAGTWDKLEELYLLGQEYGPPKNIWITEFGYPTQIEGGVSEEYQAAMISQTYLRAFTVPYLEKVFVYWFGPDGKDRSWAEDNFGLVRNDWSLKPSYKTYKWLTEYFSDMERGTLVDCGSDFTSVLFENNTQVIWSHSESKNVAVEFDNSNININRVCKKPVKMNPETEAVTITRLPLLSESPFKIISTTCNINWTVSEFRVARGSRSSAILNIKNDTNETKDYLIEWSIPKPLKVNPETINIVLKPNEIKDVSTSIISPLSTPSATTEHTWIKAKIKESSKSGYKALLEAPVKIVESFDIKFMPLPVKDEPEFIVEVTNNMNETANGFLHVTVPKSAKLDHTSEPITGLKSGQTAVCTFTVKFPSDPDMIIVPTAEFREKHGAAAYQKGRVSFYPIKKFDSPPVIDGNLDEWTDIPPINIKHEDQFIVTDTIEWQSEEDSSGKIYAAWDDDYIYFAAEVVDDERSSQKLDFSMYQNDGWEIYFDTNLEEDREVNTYNSDDYQYGFADTPEGPKVYSWSQLGGVSVNSKIAWKDADDLGKKGYRIEAAIPLEELKIKPYDGMVIGFNAALNDDDDPDYVNPFFQERVLVWTGEKNSYQNPHKFGQAFFVDPKADNLTTEKTENNRVR